MSRWFERTEKGAKGRGRPRPAFASHRPWIVNSIFAGVPDGMNISPSRDVVYDAVRFASMSAPVVMLSLQGRTFSEEGKGKQLLSVLFETEQANYAWLNKTVCVLEGVIDGKTLRMNAKVYRCVHEMQ